MNLATISKFQRLETKRLILTPISDNYLQDFVATLKNPEVSKWLNLRQEITLEKAKADLNSFRSSNTREIVLAVLLKKTQDFIGWINLSTPYLENPYRGNVGYIFNPTYWGNGYCTESIKALIKYAFECELELDSLILDTRGQNIRSQKVARRLGFKFIAKIPNQIYINTQTNSKPNNDKVFDDKLFYLLEKAAKKTFGWF